MIAFLFALGAWLWAMPYLLVGAAFIGVLWVGWRLFLRAEERADAKRAAEEAAAEAARADERALLDRMERQHQQAMCGDPRGVFGIAMPTVRQLERIERQPR